jgi:hypothetical protein
MDHVESHPHRRFRSGKRAAPYDLGVLVPIT